MRKNTHLSDEPFYKWFQFCFPCPLAPIAELFLSFFFAFLHPDLVKVPPIAQAAHVIYRPWKPMNSGGF